MEQDNFSGRELEAIEFAYNAHKDQYDKNGKPYFLHPVRVAFAVKQHGPDYFITGMLHDVVEDCGITLDEIEAKFGKEVRDAVDSVSRREAVEHTFGQHDRYSYVDKEKYFDFVNRAKSNPIGRIVKIADINDNMLPERWIEGRADSRYKKALEILEN